MSPGGEALRHFIGLSEPLKAQLYPHQLHSLPCPPTHEAQGGGACGQVGSPGQDQHRRVFRVQLPPGLQRSRTQGLPSPSVQSAGETETARGAPGVRWHRPQWGEPGVTSWLCHLLALGLWASCLPSLYLSFFI